MKRIKKTPIENKRVLNEAYDYPKKVSFTRGMRVELDNCVMLFISGTASVNEDGESINQGDLTAQTHRTYSNIKALLAAEGADFHDVVRMTCYLADFRYYDEFNEVRNAFYEEEGLDPLPASTCIEARICRPELLMETEAIASSKGGEAISHAREILRAFGTPPAGPTSTDNLANHKVGSGIGAPTRSRHFLRRYHALKQRIRDGECVLTHVPDPQMPADFLTKWIPSAKLEASLRFACNSHRTAA